MLLSLNVLFLCLSLVVIDAAPLAAPVKLDKATSKLIETSYNQGLQASSKLNALSLKSEDRTEVEESDSQGIGAVSKKGYYVILPPLHGDFPAPVAAPLPALVLAVAAPAPPARVAAPVKIEYRFDHLPNPPPQPEHRLIKKIGNILRSHIIPDGSLVFVNVAKSPVGPNVRRSVIQNIAADSDSNESLESEESTEVEESDSQEQVGTGAISRGSYSFTTPDGVVLTVNWVADESGFEGTGDHLPTPPPMPEHVVKMLTDLKAAHLL